MNNIKNSNLNSCKGFTLIELIIVVIIISVLASVAMPRYIGTVERSRAAEGISILGALRSAQERHFLENGNYTATFTDLDVELPALPNWSDLKLYTTCCAAASEPCASIMRGTTHYTLTITCSQGITCTNGSGDFRCKHAGFGSLEGNP